jgi:hypothetical protein
MKKSITIQAAREKVWDAIVSYRSSDASKRTIVSSGAGKSVVEETFSAPVVGSAKVVYEETEQPPQQIDFKMVKSDIFSKFEGRWTLSEASGGSSTVVDLTAELDVGLPFPFKDQMLNSQAAADIDMRLAYVKKKAEQ